MVSGILPLFVHRSDASLFFYARFAPLELCPGTVHPTMDMAELEGPKQRCLYPNTFLAPRSHQAVEASANSRNRYHPGIQLP